MGDPETLGSKGFMTVEVAFALPDRQRIVPLHVPPGTTAREAVERAGLPGYFPDLPATLFERANLGVFGKLLRDPEAYTLSAGDRVEVYRPLKIDPKQARAERAARISHKA
ncbi:RnfH family protein [Halomonas sp. WWR20]